MFGALLPKHHISRLERTCPNANMLASSSSDISLIMINVRSMQRRSQHGAKDGCACICFGHLVGEYVSWGDASQAPHQPFGATLPKHQIAGVQLLHQPSDNNNCTEQAEEGAACCTARMCLHLLSKSMWVSMHQGFLLGASLPKRSISRLERCRPKR